MFKSLLTVISALFLALPAIAQSPLRIEITEGVIEPLPVAVPMFQAETAGAEGLGDQRQPDDGQVSPLRRLFGR